MRWRSFGAAACLAAVMLVFCTFAPSLAQDPGEKGTKSEPTKQPNLTNKDSEELKQLQAKVKTLESQLAETKAALNQANTGLSQKLASAEALAEQAKSRTAASSQQITEAKALLAKLEKTVAELSKNAEAAKAGDQASTEAVQSLKDATEKAGTDASEGIARGDTAWMLVSSAFVMLMVPGLALFYGGMVRRKNILATMMQSMACLALVGLYWVAFGYGLAFGPSVVSIDALGVERGGLFGWSWKLFFLQDIGVNDKLPGYNIPVYVHVMFQGMFAIITPALISGAVAERIRFWPFCIFSILWITLVYCPLAHMVWAWDWFYDKPFDPTKTDLGTSAVGFLGRMVALDFAGGTVVHIAAGFAGLAACLFMRRRHGYPKTVIHPNSMVITLLGAGLLWFGWFGFNGGSGLSSTGLAGSAFAATQAAAAAAGLAWLVVEWLFKGKPTALGLASGIVAGLVAVTPASGFVYVWGGAAIGAAAGVVCYFAVALKNLLGYDDSLDAFGVHGVGGFLGAVLTGFFCYTSVNSAGADGYFAVKGEIAAKITQLKEKDIPEAKKDPARTEDIKSLEETLKALSEKGPLDQLAIQMTASVISALFAFVVSAVLVLLVQILTLGNFTTTQKDETMGLDQTEHGESGFDFGLSDTGSASAIEPKAASMPKAKVNRFELAIEGVPAEDVARLWTSLCQPSDKPVSPDFLVVYPAVTTFSGNRFRCRGADATVIATRMESLFKKLMPGKSIKVVKL